MAKLSAAEKQRLYRQRRDADPERRSAYLKKRQQTYLSDIATQKRKRVEDLTERERRRERRKWRVRQTVHREKVRAEKALMTPSSTPDSEPRRSRQKVQGRRVQRREVQKWRRKCQKLQEKLDKHKRLHDKYKKRWHRLQGNGQDIDSPRKKAKSTLQGSPRKTLIFHYALLAELRAKYKAAKAKKDKRAFINILSGKLIRKYKLRKLCEQSIGFSYKAWKSPVPCHQTNRRANQKAVKQFYIRDDVSRQTSGKKNTITLRKIRKQRRLLCDTRKNLHRRFVAEHGQVSYSFFCREKPFWVVTPKERDRETCQCKTHENLQFIVDKMHKLGLSASNNLEEMADSTVCNNSKACAYGECKDCENSTVQLTRSQSNTEVSLTQWCLEKTERAGGDEKGSFITVKKDITLTEENLVTEFEDRLFKFRRHLFNIRWQYSVYRTLRENLTNDCLVHIDFSENYTCKYASEIQSVHFGGSHNQVTLHTGVLYVAEEPPISFCTITPSKRHDPAAIWAHLDPILDMVKDQYPAVKHIHFFSDGPTSQYKQKGNFYMVCTEPYKKGFQGTTWNFFEAAHGKGAPDGVGGSLKRSADLLVRHGRDITDALSFYKELSSSGSQIQLHYVSEEEVERKAREISEVPLVTIKGTMRMHQVLSTTPGILKYRDISCVCQAAQGVWDCPCYGLQTVTLQTVPAHDLSPPHQSDVTIPDSSAQLRPDVIKSHHSGQWCIVNYDKQPYPGIILGVEEHNIKVKCMHRNGINKFFWPSPREDINWYGDEQIVCLMPEPLPVNKRSVQICHSIWKYLEEHMNV